VKGEHDRATLRDLAKDIRSESLDRARRTITGAP
jgi:hypothetical protein